MGVQLVSNELQMLSSSSLQAGFNLADYRICFGVLFAAPKGQITFMFLMNISAIIFFKKKLSEWQKQATYYWNVRQLITPFV